MPAGLPVAGDDIVINTDQTANPDGLTAFGATGSIQVSGTRTYDIGANYTYNGASPQVTGNGLAGAASLTINNPSLEYYDRCSKQNV